jgi:hypothetical protein
VKYRFVVFFILLEIIAAMTLYTHSLYTSRQRSPELDLNREVVEALSLTDPALWTEAHYTRNPTQSDRFAPFQDFPGAMEHFPAGSLVRSKSVDRGR